MHTLSDIFIILTLQASVCGRSACDVIGGSERNLTLTLTENINYIQLRFLIISA